MNWHFRTLGMGSINYRLASKRLAREAKDSGLFFSAEGFTEKELKLSQPDFWQNHSKVLHPRVPGFGWWIWKPYFIQHALSSIPEGDGLLYLDAGSVIKRDPQSLAQIREFLVLAESQSVLGSNSDYYPEELYSSRDLMDLLKLTEAQRKESQYCAAVLFVVNNSRGRAFVDKWRKLVCADDHRWSLPIAFDAPNHPDFIHHMHDQASFSCLMKTYTNSSVVTGNNSQDGVIRLARHRFAYKYGEEKLRIVYFYKLLGFASRIFLAFQRRIFTSSLSARPTPHKLEIL